MAAPATTGQLKLTLSNMNIGDYILWSYSTATGHVLGDTRGLPELPYASVTNGQLAHYWYGIKVDNGLLISDRVAVHSWSWDGINRATQMQGTTWTLQNVTGTMRSMTGGVAYADEHGRMSITDKGKGAWPTNNEWDKYVVNFPTRLIQSEKTLDDIFHWSGCNTWCQDTPVNGLVDRSTTANNTHRVSRGSNKTLDTTTIKYLWLGAASLSNTYVGIRSVFEYKEG